MTEEEIKRKQQYDKILMQYQQMIETGEKTEENYFNRICESIMSLLMALVDFDDTEEHEEFKITNVLIAIHKNSIEMLHNMYRDKPEGKTSNGTYDINDYKKWRDKHEF